MAYDDRKLDISLYKTCITNVVIDDVKCTKDIFEMVQGELLYYGYFVELTDIEPIVTSLLEEAGIDD